MKALIVSGGKAPSNTLLKEVLAGSGLIIAADSGGRVLHENNIIPHYLVGDFDSLQPEILQSFRQKGCNIVRYPSEKDYTDTEIALKLAVDKGVSELIFLGCTGSRIDHMLSNFGLLRKCLELGIRAQMKDDNNTVFLTREPVRLAGERGSFFSLQAYSDIVRKLTITGAKYELREYELNLGDPVTTSNEFLDSDVLIEFTGGTLMVILSRD